MKAENLNPLMSFEIQYFATNLLNTIHIAMLFVTIEYKTLSHTLSYMNPNMPFDNSKGTTFKM